MLYHPAHRILAAALPLVALCSAGTSNDTSDATLWNVIPDCAKTCVGNFIQGQYNSDECSSALDIKCLCRTKTPLGLTLGEAALSCLYALCAEKDIASKGNSVYHVCDPVPGAVSETHSTITATTFDPPSLTTASTGATTTENVVTKSTSQTKRVSSTLIPSSFSASTMLTSDGGIVFQPTSSESSVVPATTSMESIATTTASSTTTASPSDDGTSQKHVSPSTVIGVSVASGVAGSFIISVAVFFCCKRWKQRIGSRSDNDFFEIGGAMSEPPGFSRSSSRRSSPGPTIPPTGPSSPPSRPAYHQEVSELPCTHTPTSQIPPTIATVMLVQNADKQREREPIGVAVSSGDDLEISPQTFSSQNTLTERNLPPSAGLYPKPLKWSHRPDSGETLFEEDEFQQTQASRSKGPKISGPTRIMPGLPANPRALKNGFSAQKYLRPSPQRPYPNQATSRSPVQAQEAPGERNLTATALAAAVRGSPSLNPSSIPLKTSASSHRNSASTIFPAPFITGPGGILSGISASRPGPSQVPRPRPSPGQTTTPSGRAVPGQATPSPAHYGLGLSPNTEIVSRPRIVRRDDIKRVQIRSSPRPPSEVVAPYCPEDFWLERGRSRTPVPTVPDEPPYPSDTFPGAVRYPRSPKKRPHDNNMQRLSVTGRSLTPSKRGEDLILRVD